MSIFLAHVNKYRQFILKLGYNCTNLTFLCQLEQLDTTTIPYGILQECAMILVYVIFCALQVTNGCIAGNWIHVCLLVRQCLSSVVSVPSLFQAATNEAHLDTTMLQFTCNYPRLYTKLRIIIHCQQRLFLTQVEMCFLFRHNSQVIDHSAQSMTYSSDKETFC